MTRQFGPGERYSIDGFAYRVEQGAKAPGDLRLDRWQGDQHAPGRWRPVPMRATGLEVAFMLENESALYWRPGQLGGAYFAAWLELCAEDWRAATYKLAHERALADESRRTR
jgi:hypothetical protein